jgi:hypothetical protein
MADVADMIGNRPLVDHHTYTPKVRVSTKQPRGPNEERALTGTQCQKLGPQSPREVASILTITMEIRGPIIPMRWRTDILPCCQLHPRHLEKGQ